MGASPIPTKSRNHPVFCTSSSGLIGKKRQVIPFHRRDQQRAVEVFVAALAGGLGDEHAGVAGGLAEGAVLAALVLGAEGVGGAVLHFGQRAVDVPAEGLGLAQADEAAERAFAVGGGGVEQDSGHRSVGVLGSLGVDALADAGPGVAAFEGELAHEGVGKVVQQEVADAGIVRLGINDVARTTPLFVRFVKCLIAALDQYLLYPLLERVFAKLQEDALDAHFGGWHPVRSRA